MLLGFLDGAEPAASRFVRRFQGKVLGIAFAVTGDSGAAEEIAQGAFERMWQRADSYDAERGSVSAWVAVIARNTAIDEHRRRRRRVGTVPLGHIETVTIDAEPSELAVAGDDVRRAVQALQRLPPEQRRAVVLASWHARTAAEIAKVEGIPLGTAKTRIRTGLARLRSEMSGP